MRLFARIVLFLFFSYVFILAKAPTWPSLFLVRTAVAPYLSPAMRLFLDSSVLSILLEQDPGQSYGALFRDLRDASHEFFIPEQPPAVLMEVATRDKELGGFGQSRESFLGTYRLLHAYATPLSYTAEMQEKWGVEQELPDDVHSFAFAKAHGINVILTERTEQHQYTDLAALSPLQVLDGNSPARMAKREPFSNVISASPTAFALNVLQRDLARIRSLDPSRGRDLDD